MVIIDADTSQAELGGSDPALDRTSSFEFDVYSELVEAILDRLHRVCRQRVPIVRIAEVSCVVSPYLSHSFHVQVVLLVVDVALSGFSCDKRSKLLNVPVHSAKTPDDVELIVLKILLPYDDRIAIPTEVPGCVGFKLGIEFKRPEVHESLEVFVHRSGH